MKIFKKNEYGFDLLMSKHLRIFWDCGVFFLYIETKNYTIRFSPSAGHYIYDKRTQKYHWEN